MPHTTRATRVVAFGLLAVVVSAAAARAGEPRRIIRIYDTSTGDRTDRAAAMRTAATLVKDAGIAADWLDCTTGHGDQRCRAERGPRDLMVRIAPRYVGATDAPLHSVSTRETLSEPARQLGFSTFDSATRIGVLATVFRDRVLTVALRADVAYSVLLGRAMAHEIGHLLLPAGGHSPSGLMREVWTEAELTQNHRDDWVFAPADRRRLHAASTARPSR